MEQKRKEVIRKIVEKGYRESPFYRELLAQREMTVEDIMFDWERVPVVCKADMIQTDSSIIPPKYYMNAARNNLLQETTSGSTGQCLTIYWSKTERMSSMLPLLGYRKKYYGIRPSDNFCHFYTLHNPFGAEPKEEQSGAGLGFSKMNLNRQRLQQIFRRMREYQPVWMILQPSIAMLLARHLLETGEELPASLRYIELTGEMCTEQNRRFLEYVFDCDIANQYGSYEVNSIAYECPAGHLHILAENVFVEILRDGLAVSDEEEGSIVVTSLHNTVMPFIRYQQGDLGRIRRVSCSWHSGAVLELTRGRENDVIVCEDGQTINTYEFVKAFGCISEQLDGRLLQYQVEQLSAYRFRIHIVTDERREAVEAVFKNSLQNEYLQNCEYEFLFHEHLLPEEATGKLRFFRRNENYIPKGHHNVI